MACPSSGSFTFDDDFSAGLRSEYWPVGQTTSGLFSVDATQGSVQFTKVGSNSTGAIQNVAIAFNLAPYGGSIPADFDLSIDFSGVALGPNGVDQAQLNTHFADNSIFCDVYDNSNGGANVHVWVASILGRMAGTVTAGRFRIARVGTTLSGYIGSTLIYSKTSTSALDGMTLMLQLQPGSNDPTTVTYDNFHFTAACP